MSAVAGTIEFLERILQNEKVCHQLEVQWKAGTVSSLFVVTILSLRPDYSAFFSNLFFDSCVEKKYERGVHESVISLQTVVRCSNVLNVLSFSLSVDFQHTIGFLYPQLEVE